MTRTVGEIVEQLSSMFQFSKSASWDPVGLQFGDPAASITTVAVCHEVTPHIVDRLIAIDANLAITYHPLLFRPVTKLVAGPDAAGRVFHLISSGVAVAAVHTAFDVVAGGTADALAETLGLNETHGFGPVWGSETVKIITFAPAARSRAIIEAMAAAGAGKIGSYTSCSYRSEGTGAFLPEVGTAPVLGEVGVLAEEPEDRIEMIAPAVRIDAIVAAMVRAHPYEEPAYDVVEAKSNAAMIGRVGLLDREMSVPSLAALVKERLGGIIRTAGAGTVSKVAVIPGSGGSFLTAVDADVVVTGDVSHHQARAANAAGVAVIDPGHAATERPGVKALYAALADIVPDVVDMTDLDADPWKET